MTREVERIANSIATLIEAMLCEPQRLGGAAVSTIDPAPVQTAHK
jgi:hypothetical protein